MKKNMLLIAGATLLISAFSAGLIRRRHAYSRQPVKNWDISIPLMNVLTETIF